MFITVPSKIARCIMGPMEPKSLLYPSQRSVVRRLEVVAAADAPEGVNADYATPLYTALEQSRASGIDQRATPLAILDAAEAAAAAEANGGAGGAGGGGGEASQGAMAGGKSSLALGGAALAAGANEVGRELASGLTELRRQVRRTAGFTTQVGSNLVSRLDVVGLRAWHRKIARRAFFWNFVVKNLGWLLAAFTWAIGTWVVLAYGGLIYTYLGPGEETAFLHAWGITFLVNNFGVESIAVIWRKAFFIWIVEKMNRFLRYRTVVEWYESFLEHTGTGGAGGDDDQGDSDDDEDDGPGNGDGAWE